MPTRERMSAFALRAPGRCTESTSGRLGTQEFLLRPPELPPRVMEIILCRIEGLRRGRVRNPSTSDRLDHGQCFEGVRGIAQSLMGLVKPLALLLRELLWLTSGFHVSPSAGPWWSTVTVAHAMGSSRRGLMGCVAPLISALSAQEVIEGLEL